jgi:hypothetical protein
MDSITVTFTEQHLDIARKLTEENEALPSEQRKSFMAVCIGAVAVQEQIPGVTDLSIASTWDGDARMWSAGGENYPILKTMTHLFDTKQDDELRALLPITATFTRVDG